MRFVDAGVKCSPVLTGELGSSPFHIPVTCELRAAQCQGPSQSHTLLSFWHFLPMSFLPVSFLLRNISSSSVVLSVSVQEPGNPLQLIQETDLHPEALPTPLGSSGWGGGNNLTLRVKEILPLDGAFLFHRSNSKALPVKRCISSGDDLAESKSGHGLGSQANLRLGFSTFWFPGVGKTDPLSKHLVRTYD